MNDAERFRRAQDVFDVAVELPANRREAYVDDACAGDDLLHEQVLRLLRADAGALPTGGLHATLAVSDADIDPVGATIGAYRVERLIGQGGFGAVYLARQQEPVQREVALKIVKPGLDGQRIAERFEAERHVLARMDHPNIARVFDAGTTDGDARPFVVMELVRGDAITAYCDGGCLSTRDRLELFLPVCRAVHHAHRKAIIHRDIKPSNILVETHDERPVPKVIDFGIAKAVDDHAARDDQPIGTPQYMSPEQACGDDVDIRADVYSLGAVLYELLTGAPPLDRAAFGIRLTSDVARVLSTTSPERPSTRLSSMGPEAEIVARRHGVDARRLRRGLRGDLDWIVMRAMARDRAERYETPLDLARDIERHLANEVVTAVPASTVYRARRFVSRHAVAVVAASLVGISLVIGAGAATLGFLEARHERDDALAARSDAVDQRDVAEAVTEFMTTVFAATNRREHDVMLRDVLDDAARRADTDFVDRPHVEARVRYALGVGFHGLGLYEQAHAQLDRARTLAGDHLEPDDPTAHQIHRDLAVVCMRLRRNAEAAELFRSLLERLAAEPRDPVRVTALVNLGAVHVIEGRFEEAEPLLLEALAALEAAESPSPLLATALGELGRLEAETGRYDQAEARLVRALDVRRDMFGPDDRNALRLAGNLAAVRILMGLLDEAEATLRESLVSHERVFGPEHTATLSLKANLASVHTRRAEFAEAEEVFRDVVETMTRTLGADHPSTVTMQTNLAAACLHQGKHDEAETLLAASLDRQRATLGDDHPATLMTVDNLMALHVERGELDTAFDLALQLEAARERTLGRAHAETLLAACHLALIERKRGRLDESLTRYTDALARLRSAYGNAFPDTLLTACELADLHLERGEADAARELLDEVVIERTRALGGGHIDTLVARKDLGRALIAMDRYEAAEVELLAAREGLAVAAGASSEHAVTATRAMIALYDAWGRTDDAEAWRASLAQVQIDTPSP